MTGKINNILFSAVLKLLRPLVRIFLRNNIPFGTFSDLAKSVYVAIANEEFGIQGKKQTDSRISIITGLNRKEVRRVKALPKLDEADETIMKQYHRAARVISGWVRDETFTDQNNQPLELPIEGDGTSFSTLVKKYSGDMPVRAILDELIRVNTVERLENGSILLKTRAYLPNTNEGEKLGILGNDVTDLITTIDHNICSQTNRLFQRKVSYDNLPKDILGELRKITADRGQFLLEAMDHWLSQRDRDANPAVEGGGRIRAGVGIYYFEEDLDKKEDQP